MLFGRCLVVILLMFEEREFFAVKSWCVCKMLECADEKNVTTKKS